MPEEKELKTLTPGEWENLFRNFANPDCSRCYGRGFTGWREIFHEERQQMELHPMGCKGRRCGMINFVNNQIREKREKQLKKVEEKKQIEEEALKNNPDVNRDKAITTEKLNNGGKLEPKRSKK